MSAQWFLALCHNGENRCLGVESHCFGLKQLFGIVRAIVHHCARLCKSWLANVLRRLRTFRGSQFAMEISCEQWFMRFCEQWGKLGFWGLNHMLLVKEIICHLFESLFASLFAICKSWLRERRSGLVWQICVGKVAFKDR